jgi:hypothetical protein
MDKSATTIISSSSVLVLFLYFGLTIEEQENNSNRDICSRRE